MIEIKVDKFVIQARVDKLPDNKVGENAGDLKFSVRVEGDDGMLVDSTVSVDEVLALTNLLNLQIMLRNHKDLS